MPVRQHVAVELYQHRTIAYNLLEFIAFSLLPRYWQSDRQGLLHTYQQHIYRYTDILFTSPLPPPCPAVAIMASDVPPSSIELTESPTDAEIYKKLHQASQITISLHLK